LALLTLLVGCSSKTLQGAPPTIEPARPADSPPLSLVPAGLVRPLDGKPQAAIFDGHTAQLVILTSGLAATAPAKITAMGSQQTSSRVIDLPGPATGLAGDGSGNAYLSTRGGYFMADLSAGRVARVGVSGAESVDFTAIARRADGTLALGTADGTIYTIAPAATVSNRTKISDTLIPLRRKEIPWPCWIVARRRSPRSVPMERSGRRYAPVRVRPPWWPIPRAGCW
jgi:hypothetical protein